LKTIILTIGDPTGIGPEVTVRALQRLDEFPDTNLTIIGSVKALDMAASGLMLSLPAKGQVTYIAVEDEAPGAVSYNAIDKAVQMIVANEADALVTGPISKRNLIKAGFHYTGHTEILEDLAKRYFGIASLKAEMLFVWKDLRLMLLTRHIALREVPLELQKMDKVEQSFSILIDFLTRKMGIDKPRLAVLAANPHAGELDGTHEKEALIPIVETLQAAGLATFHGPLAADAFFRGFNPAAKEYDAIVAAYHDQGLIPFKMLAGYEAVNVTIGLPFLRTSVSHGTAEDIAGKGIAREDSLIAAIHSALKRM
jgi:4-hydroxythreonine-4-phosphate dehydrogenase